MDKSNDAEPANPWAAPQTLETLPPQPDREREPNLPMALLAGLTGGALGMIPFTVAIASLLRDLTLGVVRIFLRLFWRF